MTTYDDGIVQATIDPEAKRIHFFGAWQPEDWQHVLQVVPCYWRGLWGAHLGVAKLADRFLKTQFVPDGWTISGHSMGGMIAVHVAWALRKQGLTVQTAGSPRCVWGLAGLQVKRLKVEAYAVSGDLVPYLAPWWLGWSRAGRLKTYLYPATMPEAHEPSTYSKFLPWVTYQ